MWSNFEASTIAVAGSAIRIVLQQTWLLTGWPETVRLVAALDADVPITAGDDLGSVGFEARAA